MADVILKISLQDKDLDQLKTKLRDIAKTPAGAVELDVKQALTKVHDLRTQLRDIGTAVHQSKTPALSTVATGAKQAAIEARKLFTELKEIQTASGLTTDPKILTGLQNRAREVEKDIDRLTTKVDRVASGRLSAAGVASPDIVANPANAEKAGAAIVKLGNQSANALKLTSFQMTNLSYQINDVATMLAMGASPFQIIASQGGQIYQIFGSVSNMTAAVGAGVAKVNTGLLAWGTSLAAVGTLAAAGAVAIYGAYRVTTDIRVEAERRLNLEERIAKVYGEQNKILFDQKKTHAEAVQQQQYDFERTKQRTAMEGWSNEQLVRRKALLDQMIQLGGTGANSELWSNEVLDIDAQLNKNSNAPNQTVFSQSAELFKKQQMAEAEAARKFAANVEEAKKKADEVGKAWAATYNSLAARVSDNPMTRVFMDARSELDKLKEAIKGLPADLQQSMIASQQAFNARQLFSARLDNAMGIFDLQETARKFRDDSGSRREMLQSGIDKDRKNLEWLEKNPDGLHVNVDARREDIERRQKFLNEKFKADDPSARLDRQMEALNRLSPSDDAQRAILDRRILGFSANLDPSQLRSDQRDQIASIAERTAERQMRQEMDALNEMKRQTDILTRIETATKDLKSTAEKSGVRGVEQALNVNVSAPDGSQVQVLPTQPTPLTVDFAVGGRGGLTNR